MEALVENLEVVESDICECGQASTRGVHVLRDEAWCSSHFCDKCFNRKDLNDGEDS
jgi:hypothetical protein